MDVDFMIYKRILKYSCSCLVLSSLVACGGGGETVDGDSVEVPQFDQTQLLRQYSGLTESAPLTENDIYPTLNYLFNGDVSTLSITQQKKIAQVNRTATNLRKAQISNTTSRVKESAACSYGGEVVVSENLNQNTGVGYISYTYNQCDNGDVVLSGRQFFDYTLWSNDLLPVNYNIVYDGYQEQYSDNSYRKITGSVSVQGANSCEQNIISNLLLETDKVSVLEKDLRSDYFPCIADNPQQNLSGRIYFSNLGYVDIATLTPIILDDNHHLQSGNLHLYNEKSIIVLETKSSNTSVSVDSNNDAVIDFSVTSPSWHFTDQPYSEVRDDDKDGYLDVDDYYPNDPDLFEPLTVSITDIAFTSILGANDVSRKGFSISGSNINWTLSSSNPWLQLSHTSGKGNQEITFSFDLNSLSVGQHVSQLTLINDADGSEHIIAVTLEIIPPTLSLSADSIEFDGSLNWDELIKSLQVSLNTGSNSYGLTYTINLFDGGVVSVNAASSVGAESKNIEIVVDPVELTQGEYNGEIIFTANVLGEEVHTTLDVKILAPKHLLLIPDSGIALSKFVTAEKVNQSVDILDNYGLTSTNWIATTSSPWLRVSPSGSTNEKLTLSADATGLSVDTLHRATITVSSSDAGIENSQTINVGLWVGSSDPLISSSIDAEYLQLTTDPVRPYVYLNAGGSDIDVYNVYNQSLVTTISAVGTALGDMEVSADGMYLYVADTNDDSVIIIDLDNTSNRSNWSSLDSLAAGFALSNTNNKELLISGYGNLYNAQTGTLYVSDAHDSYYGYNYLDASLFGNRFCAVNSGISPYTVACYDLNYNSLNDQVMVSAVSGSIPHGTGSNGRDIALNNEGTIAYTASGAPYVFIPIEIDSMTVAVSLPADAYPTAVEVGPDNALHGASASWYGEKDIWVYESTGMLRTSDDVSGYAENILERGLAISGDGLISVAITSNPSVAFISGF